MKIVGVFNPYGYNIQKTKLSKPLNLYLIYQNDNEKYLIRFLDEGDLAILLSKFEHLKDEYSREKELERYLTEGISTQGYPHKYKPIKNKFYFEPFELRANKDLQTSYTSLQDFPEEKTLIEIGTEKNSQNYIIGTIFPKRELYIGSREFIYQNNPNNLIIEGKTIEEIKGIIEWLIDNSYLDEAKDIIYRIKTSNSSLEKYKHPKNFIVFDGSNNFLDQQLNRIEALEFVKSRTKHLHLKSLKN